MSPLGATSTTIRCKTQDLLEQDGAPFLENERLETEMIRL